VIVGGWLDWAKRVDGIADKVYSVANSGEGIACHSVVGEESEFEDGIPNRFFSTERDASGRYVPSAAASVMFVLRKSGELIQMYPVTTSTWTSGGFEGNTRYWAIEAEGGQYPDYGEKLTPEAAATFIRLVGEWEDHTGRSARPGDNILQHKQIAAKYGYDATACASDRYSEAWERIALGERWERDELSAEDKARLDRLERIVAGNHLTTEVWDGNIDDLVAVGIPAPIIGTTIFLTGEAALKYADRRDFSFALGVKMAQDDAAEAKQNIADHIANHAAGLASTVPAHTHKPGGVQ